jgi:GTP-binding protein
MNINNNTNLQPVSEHEDLLNDFNKIELIGQTNRGKSSLFNALIIENIAITSEEVNTTRDYIRFWGNDFILTDNMGIDGGDKLDDRIFKSNIILYVVNLDGFDDIDKQYFTQLRLKKKDFYLVVNKCDNYESNLPLWETSGAKGVLYTSTKNNYGIKNLRNFLKITITKKDYINEKENENIINKELFTASDKLKIALVGGVNSGKSSLLNLLVGHRRSKVSSVAATTRDVVMEPIGDYMFFDTAGFNAIDKKIEKIAIKRTEEIIKNVDICLIVIDVEVSFSQWNKWLWQYGEKLGKGIIFIFNKSDLLKKDHIDKKYLLEQWPIRNYIPYLFFSTFHKDQISKLYKIINNVAEAFTRQISKSQMSYFLKHINLPSNNSTINIVQKSIQPQTFIVYTKKELIKNYKQYLENQIISYFKLKGVRPIMIYREMQFKDY